ncbi:prohibitin family protein [Schleiferia thermophila]|jgi:prohibitin 1|uniref:Regulator of protease activity HflC (Stomatin/prohibitin superfamily) n=1 Tax=Schleiferia thermophila TaxID=884107 RepID=A0A369A6G0_9FLAO|nr:prohibitin family protein [Schleiferia thermophila]KFD39456.1 membrane protease subunit, stomatin/prohibitin [Schleiferia thermophila str. Yellowstone]RCX04932.1 regulator of protease activity HflC (stomatin/prohibitin superfamily) [Schleiferia thermophila]
MKTIKLAVSLLILSVVLPGCAVIRQGDVGVKRTLGKISKREVQPGLTFYNPFFTTILRVPTRTTNIEIRMDLPSKEGLNVKADISILYHVNERKATDVIATIGKDFETSMILPVFRAAASDVTAKYMAKDMHSGNRLGIENEIRNTMAELLEPRGFVIEAVLLKTIQLPPGLYRAIEEKLEAEQDAERMKFILQREKLEAERKLVEAQGIRDANKLISEGLTPAILQYKTIEAYRELSRSPNTKIIIGSGNQPIIMQP